MKHKIHCCYHEAGHAVVATALNVPVHMVKVYRQNVHIDGYQNQTWTGGTKLLGDKPSSRETALIAFAGPAAEARYIGADNIEKFCSLQDLQDANEALAGEDSNASQADAIKYVDSHWRWIERVAKLLEQDESITGHQVRDLRP